MAPMTMYVFVCVFFFWFFFVAVAATFTAYVLGDDQFGLKSVNIYLNLLTVLFVLEIQKFGLRCLGNHQLQEKIVCYFDRH